MPPVLAASGGGLDGGGLDGGGLELPPVPRSRTTVTVMLPGFTVSVQSVHAPCPVRAAGRSAPSGLETPSVTVVLCPEASVPAVGETVTWPTRPEDSAMDQLTDPNDAFRVSVPPFGPSTIVVGVTVSRPRLGGELVAAVAVLADVLGAGELGFALDAGAGLVGEASPL